MKKILLSITTFFSFAVFVNAQNTSPYGSLAGNSNATAASKLGTTNNIGLRFYTNNVQRMFINSAAGYVGIGSASPVNILTVQSSGGVPAASWLNGLSTPIFMGFAEGVSSEFVLAAANSSASRRAVLQGRRSRGTLAAPLMVANNDYLASFLASGYDGTTFQNPATIDFFVDGTPSSGHVPTRISFVTGTNGTDRVERLKVGNTGNFNFNNTQLFLRQSDGNVGIGTVAPSEKLHVTGKGLFTAGIVVSNGGVSATNTGFGSVGVYGVGVQYGVSGDGGTGGTGVYGTSDNIGVTGSNNTYGTGAYGYSYNGTGVRAVGGTYGVDARGGSYGVYSVSDGGYALYAYSGSSYAGVFYSESYSGISASTNTGAYAGEFYGDVYCSGAYQTSDRNLKMNIQEFGNAMSIINKLKPQNYEFKNDAKYASLHLPKGNHYGLIAQDMEKVLPNFVSEAPHQLKSFKPSVRKQDAEGKPLPVAVEKEIIESVTIKAVNYTELIPVIIKALQEQDATIQKQSAKIEELTALVNKLSPNLTGSSKFTGASLGQSMPNPATKSTRVNYTIPTEFYKAELVINNEAGKR